MWEGETLSTMYTIGTISLIVSLNKTPLSTYLARLVTGLVSLEVLFGVKNDPAPFTYYQATKS